MSMLVIVITILIEFVLFRRYKLLHFRSVQKRRV